MSTRGERLAWDSLPPELRERAIQILRRELQPTLLEHVRTLAAADPEGWITPYHFSTGMYVRNVLRLGSADLDQPKPDGIKDEELAPPAEPHELPRDHGNWDDFYVRALELAAGVA